MASHTNLPAFSATVSQKQLATYFLNVDTLAESRRLLVGYPSLLADGPPKGTQDRHHLNPVGAVEGGTKRESL